MRKYYFLIALSISFIYNSYAQVVLKGADVFLSSGALFHVNDSLIVDDAASTLTNNGQLEANDFLLLQGQLNNTTSGTTVVRDSAEITTAVTNDGTFQGGEIYLGASSTFQNNGVLQIDQLFQPTAGAAFPTSSGAIEFVGDDDNKLLDIGGIYAPLVVRKMSFNAANPARTIILESNIRVSDTADFNSGRVQYSVPTDSLVVLGGGLVIADTNGAGIMTDALYRYPGSPGEFMRFPVGDASPRYRPFWIKGAQYSSAAPKIAVEYLGTRVVPNNNLIGYNTNYNQNSWGFSILENSFDSSIVQVQYATGDVTTPSETVVAEGFEVIAGDTIFFNLGSGPGSTTIAGGGVVESLIPAQGNSVVMIGESSELKLNLRVILEGAITTGITMGIDPEFRDTIRNRFEFGGFSTKPMLNNKVIPVTAVDSIKIYLRSGALGPIVDSASAWLMSDGSIRDYITGDYNYAIFTNASAGNYDIVVEHRNHLRIQSAQAGGYALSNVVNAIPVDFTNAANIYGGGGYKIIGASAVVAAGNSNQDNEVNSLDYTQVYNDNAVIAKGYINTDVLFSATPGAETNVDDLNKTNQNSGILYFSTVP